MKLLEMLLKNNYDLFKIFINNAYPVKLENKIVEQNISDNHYIFSKHRVYLVKSFETSSLQNQMIGFDLKYDTSEIVNYDIDELEEIYRSKSFLRKIKLNKQPSILTNLMQEISVLIVN